MQNSRPFNTLVGHEYLSVEAISASFNSTRGPVLIGWLGSVSVCFSGELTYLRFQGLTALDFGADPSEF